MWKKIRVFGHSKGRWWGLGWNRGSHGDRAALLTYNAGTVLQLQAEPRATHAGFRLPLRYVTRFINDLALLHHFTLQIAHFVFMKCWSSGSPSK